MSDLISRQAAIDALKNRWKKTRNYEGIGDDIAEECELYLKQVPSAQPERKTEDFEKGLHDMFDHIWNCEIEHPMFEDTVGELMQAVIQLYRRVVQPCEAGEQDEYIPASIVEHALETLPTADVEPVRHGKWISGNPICPCCGEDKFKDLDADIWADWQPQYCPNCGARMDEKQESDKYDTRIKDIT